MSLWNPDNIRDVAESLGLMNLSNDVTENLSRDVEYRVSQVLEEALKSMRHSKRTVLTTSDISFALRQLDLEPLYGYESNRPVRFGEASLGPGQPLFYVEDEEVDFEKLINAPLPRVPREVTLTAHWLAIDGVQPSIPQNPTAADSRNLELVAKGPNANATSAAMSGSGDVDVKPLVKHVLSRELQLYFDKVCGAFLDESSEEYRASGYASLHDDPGLSQLVPYFVQFISEKVTHNLQNIFVLTQMMRMAEALVQNKSLYIDPYVSSFVPPILTCLIGRQLGGATDVAESFALRDMAASLIGFIAKKYESASHLLKPRIVRSCYKNFMDLTKSFNAHYGAILGLQAIAGTDLISEMILPVLKMYGGIIAEGLNDSGRRPAAERVANVIFSVLIWLRQNEVRLFHDTPSSVSDEIRSRLVEAVGPLFATKVVEANDVRLALMLVDVQPFDPPAGN
ncbi:Transcription initiation factor TFIID complex 60 kDa subunit [Penicillium malachiteum]|uniref:Transcription initiation factor TFIID complex 60 kDa subunit n=1 Tax=Penicillium malachiteum TaxID=1324776 RepID=UPI0025468E5C|nr:Transcription initiation factor TFIID complex 60 kDa subunit [Penicillium malachiteum]KAJ5735765.1 Transcription initiation factor TFIID complex 60 kDa subunit [Penicillium malachiteum]